MSRPPTTTRTTPELREGDLLLHHGMKLRLAREIVRKPCCEGHERGPEYGHCDPEDGHGETVAFIGIITNPDDPDVDEFALNLARGERLHRDANGRWVPDGDDLLWTVQGNALARWAVIDES
jgi:hypothetical protein